jgi:type II secretory pathway predicted ATPase ExeA
MYDKQQAALEFLQDTLSDERGLALMHGPEGSGKSAVVARLLESIPDNVAVANIDGTRLHAPEFLSQILGQFGYGIELDTARDMLKMLKVIVIHLTRSHEAPVLVVRNLGAMYPSCLAVLCSLASQRVRQRYALRIILVGNRPYRKVTDSPKMEAVAERLIGRFDLGGVEKKQSPGLIVTFDGEVVQDFELADTRALIGRSDFCDIQLEENCVSRQHALLVRDEDALILFDLRSKNRTFVNSTEITTRVLHDSDIISIGNHRLKVVLPDYFSVTSDAAVSAGDTARMKRIEDARREKLRRHMRLIADEELKA